MRPQPFVPVPYLDDERFVRDQTSGLIFHKVFHRVLYADTDRSGVVYHANYLRYFELGRTSVMRDVGYPYAQVEDSGFVYPIVDLGIKFYKPLIYDSPMWVYSRPSELERVRIRFEYVILHAQTSDLVCKGFTLHCALNEKGMPTAVDPTTMKTWQTFPRVREVTED